MTIPLALAAALTSAFVVGAGAQELPRLTRLADGVYVYEHADPTKAGVTANNLVVVTAEGVLVADGQGTADNTRQLVAAIAAVTRQPVRYVVVGSEHGDHRGGDAGFPPGATFIAHPSSRSALERQARAPDRRPNAAAVVVPTETVADARTLTLGGREIRIQFFGRAHTGGDLAVYLPRERIVFLSEIFLDRIFPSMANGYPREWLAALDRAAALDADTWISAHGRVGAPLSTGRNAVMEYTQAIQRVVAEASRLHGQKVPADGAAAQADFGAFAGWLRAADNAPGALKRVYLEIDGGLR
jgi:glyoxylase-like metal-dependent hydrolase (beta-lactamase superfamily II)